jgi:chaperonin cofactor prefoldin
MYNGEVMIKDRISRVKVDLENLVSKVNQINSTIQQLEREKDNVMIQAYRLEGALKELKEIEKEDSLLTKD